MAIDPARLKSQLRADANVLQNLAKYGDVSTIIRPIDLRFIVKPEVARNLEREIEKAGWVVLQTVPSAGGMLAIDAQGRSDNPDARDWWADTGGLGNRSTTWGRVRWVGDRD